MHLKNKLILQINKMNSYFELQHPYLGLVLDNGYINLENKSLKCSEIVVSGIKMVP